MSITLEITDEYNVKVIEDLETKKTIKYIEIDDLITILKASKEAIKITDQSKKEKILFRSPIFPSFNGVSTISYVIVNDDTQYIYLKKDKAKHDFNLHGKIYKNISFPTFVFSFKVTKGIIQEAYVVCTKDQIITEKTRLYKFPFGNVFSSGSICFGSNLMKDHVITDYLQLHSMPSRFLMMETTANTNHTKYKMQTTELLTHLEEDEFDDEKLIPYDYNFKAFIENTSGVINL